MDLTTLHPTSADQGHRVDLHLWRGAPENLDEDRPVQILVNDGYVVGFCPSRLQPVWSAYRVAHADKDVDFDRPHVYYDDMRLPEEHRIGRKTFGKMGEIQLHVGHMTPNEVINRQFGRLAQMETFFMSNMSPQYGSLNTGVWLKLENAIREIKDEKGRDHVWAIVGPVFGDQPASIDRGNGKYLPVPDKYFCVLVDPHSYPFDKPSNADINCFMIPQGAPKSSLPQDYPATLEEVEEATNLRFFASWGRELPLGVMAADAEVEAPATQSRIDAVLETHREKEEAEKREILVAERESEADTIDDLIDELRAEAASIEVLGRALTQDEADRVRMIQHTISWLIKARDIANPPPEPVEPPPPTLVTYKIVSDWDDRLKHGARTACNFWNRFLVPSQAIVIRLGVFTQNSSTIARAYQPYWSGDTRYGRVEFNTKYLVDFTDDEIAGTIVHEIGHSLGIGWDDWSELFDEATGLFNNDAVARMAELAAMEVERDGGPGTALAHWDEARFDRELMTGYQDHGEHVLPQTIAVMGVLGHEVNEYLNAQTPLGDLLQDAAAVLFSRQDEAELIDRDHFVETDLLETIPHDLPATSA
ncbi:MAG: DNA/RNA endonuclease [Sulfitobacter sp.]|nr:DNA/RNA endonuclease [Sulfitobacter sp.]